MSYVVNPKFVRYGQAKKSCFEMTKEEFKEAAEAIMRDVRQKAFSRGLPIFYAKDHIIYAEYSDGRIDVVKNCRAL